MEKKAYYIYNPATDNFERVYPTLKNRLRYLGGVLLLATLIGGAMFAVAFFGFASHTERTTSCAPNTTCSNAASTPR